MYLKRASQLLLLLPAATLILLHLEPVLHVARVDVQITPQCLPVHPLGMVDSVRPVALLEGYGAMSRNLALALRLFQVQRS